MHQNVKRRRTCAIIRGLYTVGGRRGLPQSSIACAHQSSHIERALPTCSVACKHRFVDVNQYQEPHPILAHIGYSICASIGGQLQ